MGHLGHVLYQERNGAELCFPWSTFNQSEADLRNMFRAGATNLAQFLRHTSQPRSILTGRFHQISIPTLDLRA
jgi:hypothetical protein